MLENDHKVLRYAATMVSYNHPNRLWISVLTVSQFVSYSEIQNTSTCIGNNLPLTTTNKNHLFKVAEHSFAGGQW